MSFEIKEIISNTINLPILKSFTLLCIDLKYTNLLITKLLKLTNLTVLKHYKRVKNCNYDNRYINSLSSESTNSDKINKSYVIVSLESEYNDLIKDNPLIFEQFQSYTVENIELPSNYPDFTNEKELDVWVKYWPLSKPVVKRKEVKHNLKILDKCYNKLEELTNDSIKHGYLPRACILMENDKELYFTHDLRSDPNISIDDKKLIDVDSCKCNLSNYTPLHHSAMVAIAGINEINRKLYHSKTPLEVLEERKEAIESGIPIEPMLGKHLLEEEIPYYCLNYDCFLTHEPCTMCAMGLLLSRISKVYYIHDADNGPFSKQFLHSYPNLNHHFQVFKVKLNK